MDIETPKGMYLSRDPRTSTYHVNVWKSTDDEISGYIVAETMDERRSWGVYPDHGHGLVEGQPIYTALNQFTAVSHAVELASAINSGLDPRDEEAHEELGVVGCTMGVRLGSLR